MDDVTFVLGRREVAVARANTEWLRNELKALDLPRTGGKTLSDKIGRALRTGEPVIVEDVLRSTFSFRFLRHEKRKVVSIRPGCGSFTKPRSNRSPITN
jgi:hypothetical protein